MRFAFLLHKSALVLWLIAAFACAAAAQTTATLTGSVHESVPDAVLGAIIPNAALTLTNLDTGDKRTAKSDSNGSFSFLALTGGNYQLLCEMQGFKTQVYQKIVLGGGESVRLDIGLKIGDASESVIVTAEAVLLQTEAVLLQTETAGIDRRMIVELPLASYRNYQSLLNLVPGATPASFSRNDDLTKLTVEVNGSLVSNLYSADLYSAESGAPDRSLINFATKSGTNRFHGSVFEDFRNDRLNARNLFDLADANRDGKLDRPVNQHNQFGFSLGGPIWKDHTFFFGTVEWLRARTPQSRVLTVPTAKMRQGDFSEFGDGNPTTTNDIDLRNPFVSGQPVFVGNLIPQNLRNTATHALLTFLPEPNRPGVAQNLAAVPASRNHTNQFTLRLDHNVSASGHLFGRLVYSDTTANAPFRANRGEVPVPGFGLNLATNSQNLAVNYTHTLTPTFFIDIWFRYKRINDHQEHQNKGNAVGLGNGLAGLFATGQNEIGVPRIVVTGLNSFGDEPQTLHRKSHDFQYDGSVSLIKGSHSVKFGGSFQPLTFVPTLQNNVRGSFSFGASAVTSGIGFADFLLGLPDSAASGAVAAADFKSKEFSGFVQDSWQVRRRFSLAYGVRYEYTQPPIDQKLQAANFDLQTRTLIIPSKDGHTAPTTAFRAAPNGILTCVGEPCFQVRPAVDLGIQPGLIVPDRNNFSPRFGLAWGATDYLTLRGGYGLYYSHHEQLAALTMVARPPFWPTAYLGPTVSPCLLQTQMACEGVARLQIQNALASPNSGPFLSPVNPSLRTGYSQQGSLSLEVSFKQNWKLEVGYLGAKGKRLFTTDSRNYRRPAAAALNDNTREFFPYNFGMEVRTDSGFSSYHSLQINLNKRMSNGLLFSNRYVWSKSLDNDNVNGSNDPFNRVAEKGRSEFDARHRLSFNAVYELPFGRGRKFASGWTGISDKLIGSWQLGCLASWGSATPFSVESPFDFANIGRTFANRPDLVGLPNTGPKTAEQWFNASAFANPMRGSFGTAGRNILDGDSQAAINVSLIKRIVVSEATRIDLRAEFSNATNNTNYGTPNRIYIPPSRVAATDDQASVSNNINPNFGRIFNAGDPRVVTLVFRLSF